MQPTIKDIVIKDYRTADVFKKWGINYCCGGNQSLEAVCQLQGLDKNLVNSDIETATRKVYISASINYHDWPIEFLADYIINIHHQYIYNAVPQLKQTLTTFVEGHRKKYPYLDEVKEAFLNLADELLEHSKNEEENIFPYLKQIGNIHSRKETYGKLFVKTLSKPLEQIIDKDHKRLDALLKHLRRVTNNYQFAENACTNHQVIYHKFRELDNDLIQHKYLENEILFPKIMAMEKELLQL